MIIIVIILHIICFQILIIKIHFLDDRNQNHQIVIKLLKNYPLIFFFTILTFFFNVEFHA
jgi:hypothetical protein